MRKFDLLDKHLGLILVDISIGLPLVIWLMRGYFASIPADLENAARIDGCTYLSALWSGGFTISWAGFGECDDLRIHCLVE